MSFSATARPNSSPRGHGVRRGTQSAMTSVINTTLTWPNAKFDRIGSQQTTAGATIAAASQHRRTQAGSGAIADCGHTRSPVSTIANATISSTRVVPVIAALAAGSGSHANGLNAIAASGG